MLGSAIVETALGLFFLYSLLSLVCTTITEGIMSAFGQRAKFLRAGLAALFQADRNPGQLNDFLHRPLIAALFAGRAGPTGAKRLPPSYLPTSLFVQAAVDATAAAISAWQACADRGEPVDASWGTPFERALWSLWKVSAGDGIAYKKAVGDWYDAVMDGVSGWYKRRVRRVGLGVAVATAVACNADTLNIAKTLYENRSMRSGLVESAKVYADMVLARERTGPAPNDTTIETAQQFAEQVKEIFALHPPMGWSASNRLQQSACGMPLGWLLTAFAVSLGAPFWFNVLETVLRVAKKPQSGS